MSTGYVLPPDWRVQQGLTHHRVCFVSYWLGTRLYIQDFKVKIEFMLGSCLIILVCNECEFFQKFFNLERLDQKKLWVINDLNRARETEEQADRQLKIFLYKLRNLLQPSDVWSSVISLFPAQHAEDRKLYSTKNQKVVDVNQLFAAAVSGDERVEFIRARRQSSFNVLIFTKVVKWHYSQQTRTRWNTL